MKFFVAFVATLACAVANPSYAPYAAPSPYSYGYSAYAAAPYAYGYAPAVYHAPADIKVLPSGFLADTPEVASAKAAHLAEKAKASSYATPYAASYAAPYAASYAAPYVASYAAPYAAPYAASYAGAYKYAPADIKVLPSGYLADTPEVAHSKVAHAAASAHAAAAAAASPDYTSPAAYAAPAYSYAAPAYSYAAPAYSYAAPSVYQADTPEVAHAKAAHLAAKAAASSYASPSHY